MKSKLSKIILVALLTLSIFKIVPAEEINLERIVVTPSRYAQEIGNSASSISVVDAQEIGSSNANTIPDVLRGVPGIMVRDYYGNASKVSVDTRGFGEQGALDTLVMVDGRRVNEIDQSGVDWTQVPLDRIEKIEIIRGGSAGVLYGDNAVSGVINIITKKGQGKPKFELEGQIGSYAQNQERLTFSGSTQELSYLLSGSFEGTQGYRNNSYYNSTDFNTKFDYDLSSNLSLRFSNGYKKSSYGIPGPLTEAQMQQFDRRYALYGDDHANNLDYYFDLGALTKSLPLGSFDLDLSYRKKNVDTLFLTSIAYPGGNPIYKNNITTIGFTPKYVLDKDLFVLKNKFIAGADFYRSEFISDNYSPSDVLENYAHINKSSVGLYLQDELGLLDGLNLTGGWRWEQARYTFNYHDFSGFNSDIDSHIIPDQQAFSSGLVYNYKEDSSVFLNFNQNFRFPATDEYYSVWGVPPVNTNLKPQTSKNIELGLRHSFNQEIKFDFSFFRMDVENELYYNPLTYANENYDQTLHQGVELALNAKLFKLIKFFANYAYTQAIFEGGVYDKKVVPMVPNHKGSLGFTFIFPNDINVNILGNFVGSRYFINDQANQFSKLDGYITADANISYKIKDFSITAAVNNVFNQLYSEYGVCNSVSGAKNYYPSPGRNFNLKAKYVF